jgi:hypothetical protein
VLSLQAPVRLVKDAIRGIGWAVREGVRSLQGPAVNVMRVSEP